MKIRLASSLTQDSIVDGPGLRTVLWTQGCPHACFGCHNPNTHDMNAGIEVDVQDVIAKMREIKLQKGITLSGGEPFMQPEALLLIAKEARALGWDVWAYTGFTYEWLLDKRNPRHEANLALLKEVDVLVDGKFVMAKKDFRLKFRGSSNQRVIDVKKSLENNAVEWMHEYK